MPLELRLAPAALGRLPLVEIPRRPVLHPHQRPVVRPRKQRCEGLCQFATRRVANWALPVGKRLIELSEILQIGNRKAAPIPFLQPFRQALQDLLAICRPFLAALHGFHDLPPDQPVSRHHLRVDRPYDPPPRLLKDRYDAVKQGIVRRWRRFAQMISRLFRLICVHLRNLWILALTHRPPPRLAHPPRSLASGGFSIQ